MDEISKHRHGKGRQTCASEWRWDFVCSGLRALIILRKRRKYGEGKNQAECNRS